MKQPLKYKIELNENQFWVLTKALMEIVSDDGIERMQKEFPLLNIQDFADEVEGITDLLVEAKENPS